MKQWQIAVVVQRYGLEVAGGAELLARWLAEHLLALGDVQVITTCALDFTTWASVYPPGRSELNGVIVHRFPVDQERNWSRAQRDTGRFLLRQHSIDEELAWIQEQGPFSTPLLQFIQDKEANFDVFIFVTYHYATTFFGLPLVAHKSILTPAAHEDPFLGLPIFRSTFDLPQAIVYLTETEKRLVNRVVGNQNRQQDIVAGIGINVPEQASASRFRQKYGIEGDFLLYVGRIVDAKNVPELISHFTRFRQEDGPPLQLVLAGKSHLDLPSHPDIFSLGFISEQDKFDAIRAAALVVMPSLFESLSMIVLESWLMEIPVLVNGRCQVLKHQCQRANGGLYYANYREFSEALRYLLPQAELRGQLGRQGRKFALTHYHWDRILEKYDAVIRQIVSEQPASEASRYPRSSLK